MSEQYPGGFVTKNLPTVSTSSAQGMWTLSQQAAYKTLGIWPTPYNANNYIENLFNTYVYDAGISSIVNGINFSANGGLIWFKYRSGTATETNNELYDTVRGAGNFLVTNGTAAQVNDPSSVNSFNTDGVTVSASDPGMNNPGARYVAWSFRQQEKFFKIASWTGNGATSRTISHGLGSVPGCVIVRAYSGAANWLVYHASLGYNYYGTLNSTEPFYNNAVSQGLWTQAPTSTDFYIGDGVNANGVSYIAYFYANNAGGFGASGTENVVSCGSFTTDAGAAATVNLGYEPQWLMLKQTGTSNWQIFDNSRGFATQAGSQANAMLNPNLSSAESSEYPGPTSTGFNVVGYGASTTWVYVAIRRGPMAAPTVGTSVFNTLLWTGNGASSRYISGAGFAPDLVITSGRNPGDNKEWDDRLRGWGSTATNSFYSNNTNAEATDAGSVQYLYQDGEYVRLFNNASGTTYNAWNLRRAPSFFDEVCYTGNGSAGTTRTHNLGAIPEFMIVKRRSAADNWAVYHSALTASNVVQLNTTSAATAYSGYWNNTAPTASVFTTGAVSDVNGSASTYSAWLFATCPGVSKVGSYTGTGATQTIACGFTGGARFVLIKRTDSTGDWYVWDSARGMVAGTDPSLLLNTATAEVNANSVYSATGGFQIVSTAAGINASGGAYIFLAIA